MPPTSETLRTLLRVELDSAHRILRNASVNLAEYGYSLPITDAELAHFSQETRRALSIVQDLRAAVDSMQRAGSFPLRGRPDGEMSRILVDFDGATVDGVIRCSIDAVPARFLATPEVVLPCEDRRGRTALARIARVDERLSMVWLRLVNTGPSQSEAPTNQVPIRVEQHRR